jgi:hypothetical protein
LIIFKLKEISGDILLEKKKPVDLVENISSFKLLNTKRRQLYLKEPVRTAQ